MMNQKNVPFEIRWFPNMAETLKVGDLNSQKTHVWMTNEDFERLTARMDPKTLARIRQQSRGCTGCGDSPIDGI